MLYRLRDVFTKLIFNYHLCFTYKQPMRDKEIKCSQWMSTSAQLRRLRRSVQSTGAQSSPVQSSPRRTNILTRLERSSYCQHTLGLSGVMCRVHATNSILIIIFKKNNVLSSAAQYEHGHFFIGVATFSLHR